MNHNRLRSTASAMRLHCSISWAKAAGVIVWEPSLMACSGSSWTSMIRPSAPAATAARAIGGDQIGLAGAVRRVDHHRQVGLVVQVRDRGQRQGEPRVVLEGADAALAEHDVGIAAVEDVLGGQQEFVHRGAHAALQQDRLAESPTASSSW